jgi:hypothetical protein
MRKARGSLDLAVSHASSPLAVIVLGDRSSRVGKFVERNLRASEVAPHFANATDEFVRLTADVDASRVILIEPDWDLMLKMDYPDVRLLTVRWRGDDWTPPWEGATFEVRDPYVDDRRFRRHVAVWLRDG